MIRSNREPVPGRADPAAEPTMQQNHKLIQLQQRRLDRLVDVMKSQGNDSKEFAEAMSAVAEMLRSAMQHNLTGDPAEVREEIREIVDTITTTAEINNITLGS